MVICKVQLVAARREDRFPEVRSQAGEDGREGPGQSLLSPGEVTGGQVCPAQPPGDLALQGGSDGDDLHPGRVVHLEGPFRAWKPTILMT